MLVHEKKTEKMQQHSHQEDQMDLQYKLDQEIYDTIRSQPPTPPSPYTPSVYFSSEESQEPPSEDFISLLDVEQEDEIDDIDLIVQQYKSQKKVQGAIRSQPPSPPSPPSPCTPKAASKLNSSARPFVPTASQPSSSKLQACAQPFYPTASRYPVQQLPYDQTGISVETIPFQPSSLAGKRKMSATSPFTLKFFVDMLQIAKILKASPDVIPDLEKMIANLEASRELEITVKPWNEYTESLKYRSCEKKTQEGS